MTFTKFLICRECRSEFPISPINVCDYCFGPLDVEYDFKKIKEIISRQRIIEGPLSIWRYKDLFYFLVWSDIKTRYAQSVLGIGWAVIQPVFSMIVFTIVFGNLAKIDSNGVPYAIFSFTALFSNTLVCS